MTATRLQTRRETLRARLDANAVKILDHMSSFPDDFDGREDLWMDRAFLQREYEASA
jgi:hypothetical protein